MRSQPARGPQCEQGREVCGLGCHRLLTGLSLGTVGRCPLHAQRALAETTALPTRAWSVGLNFPDPPSRISPAGCTLDENPEVLRIFEGFVEHRGWNKTEIIHPAQAGNGNVYVFLLTF